MTRGPVTPITLEVQLTLYEDVPAIAAEGLTEAAARVQRVPSLLPRFQSELVLPTGHRLGMMWLRQPYEDVLCTERHLWQHRLAGALVGALLVWWLR